MHRLLLSLKILGILALLLILFVAGATALLNTASFQNKMMGYATGILSERLSTRITLDSISLNLFGQQVELYGLDVEDQQQRKMLQVRQLAAKASLKALLSKEVKIEKLTLLGCQAQIVKTDSDSVANYQFVIDSLKRKHSDATAGKTDAAVKQKQNLTLDFNNVTVEDISLQYNDNHYRLKHLTYRQQSSHERFIQIRDVCSQWTFKTRKGPLDNVASLYALTYREESGQHLLTIDSLRYKTENHLPRKNKLKPKRGAFDPGHLDLCANIQATLDSLAADTLVATVKATAQDEVAGIDLQNISLRLSANRQVAHLADVTIRQGNTTLKFDEGEIRLPHKREGRTLSYSTSTIAGHVILQDISKPFAPVLSRFTQPLQLKVKLSGDDNTMAFHDVHVNTPDKTLTIIAMGSAVNLKDAHQLVVRFDVARMYARGGSKEKIISQFPVKKLMMKQLHALGDISYTGRFAVLWRKEQFSGKLLTQVGNLNFQFTIDETAKYIQGTSWSDSIQVNKTFDLPNIGAAKCKTKFNIDISKERTARMRRQKGGKLPIGQASIQVEEASYKGVKVRNIFIDFVSDGAKAEGSLKTHGRHMDLSCNFSFTNTDEMKKMTIIKPNLKLHKLSGEDRQKKAEEKARKKAEKKARKGELHLL